jgi:hypothetical protein
VGKELKTANGITARPHQGIANVIQNANVSCLATTIRTPY